ncbi:MAG TPA: hypothetical protein VMH81_05425 [Bryobacteraceae bacterium]|nr:hypothetical protein [Bryobacteraceae bacterium]
MRVRSFFRYVAPCASLILCTATAFAATAADLDALIAAARSVPAEFSADALIRIAALGQLDKDRRIELLEQAFQKASGAQQPFKRHAAPLRTDGSAGYWNRVYSQDLDRLSLRLRAVEAMLPLDKGKARELFLQIPSPDTPRLTCEEFQVYDVSRFYDLLGVLVQQAYSDSEAESGERFRLLQRYAGAVTTSVQVAPMAHVLAAAKVSDDEYQKLVGAFGSALGKVTGDDRSFAYSTGIGRELLPVVEECKRRHITPLPLLEAYRVYLVINLSANRCADDDLMSGGGTTFGVFANQQTEPNADFVAFFNEKLRMAPLQPIGELEATPARLEGVATGLRACEDETCRVIAARVRGLFLKPEGGPYLPAEREKPEWQENLRAAISAVSEWKENKETGPAEYFRERCAAYAELLNVSLNGSGREPVLHALLSFVNQNGFQATSRMEWFLPVNALVGRVGLDPHGLEKFGAELRQASDPVVALYAKLEALAPRPPDRVLALL